MNWWAMAAKHTRRARRHKGPGPASPVGRARSPRYPGSVSPYREAAAADVLEAPTRDGVARLEIAPDHTLLRIARKLQVSITRTWATIVTGEPRARAKPRSLPLGESRLVVARGVPTEEVALWYEERPNVVGRVVGLRPPELLDADALAAWRALD